MTPLEAMMLDAKQIALRAGTRMGNVPLSPRPTASCKPRVLHGPASCSTSTAKGITHEDVR